MLSFHDLSRLDGRVAVVIGGAGHVGAAAVAVFEELGAQVVVVDRRMGPFAADERAGQRNGTRGDRLEVEMDVTAERAGESLVNLIAARFGRVDVLAYTAALVGDSPLPGWVVPFQEQSLETWRKAIEVNLSAFFAVTQALTPLLGQGGKGAVIATASIYGEVGPDHRLYQGTGMGNPAAYAASKGGMLQLVRWLATTLAPHVRVNAISPGGIARGQPAAFVERYEARTPLGRMGVEEDLLGAFAYLGSDLSQYVTGQNLIVDGGFSVW